MNTPPLHISCSINNMRYLAPIQSTCTHLARLIRDLKSQVDEKLSAFNAMTQRRKETMAELTGLAASFDADLSRLRAELGDHLAADDTVRQVAAEKSIFNLRGKREKLENFISAFDSALDKQQAELRSLKSELVALEKDYWADLFMQHRAKLDTDHMMLTWALSIKAGWRTDDCSDFFGRMCGGGPGSSPRDPKNVPGLSERLENLSPYKEAP